MREGDLYEGQELPNGWTTKTDGGCNVIIVRDPDYINEDGSIKRKVRRNSNYTKPKKRK